MYDNRALVVFAYDAFSRDEARLLCHILRLHLLINGIELRSGDARLKPECCDLDHKFLVRACCLASLRHKGHCECAAAQKF